MKFWVKSANELHGHVGEALQIHQGTVDCLLSDGMKRALPEDEFIPLTTQKPLLASTAGTARVLCRDVNTSEKVLRKMLAAWSVLDEASAEHVHLQVELVDYIICSFLSLAPVDMRYVRAVGCSSKEETTSPAICSIENALDPSTDNFWISADGTMPAGCGHEWVSFRLGAEGDGPWRVALCTLVIPPLPHGALSVRRFHLEVAQAVEGPWVRASKTLKTLNTRAAQTYHIEPPIEAMCVRIVCTQNAARASADVQRALFARRGMADLVAESQEDLSRLRSSVGFFSISFAP